MKYVRYLILILKHKYFVFVEGMRLHVPIARLIKHDMSKFRPSEFFVFAERFEGQGKGLPEEALPPRLRKRFADAVDLHHSRNDHHWNYWFHRGVYPMSWDARNEMIADWLAVSRLRKSNVVQWYSRNKNRMILHRDDRNYIEYKIGYLPVSPRGLRRGDRVRERNYRQRDEDLVISGTIDQVLEDGMILVRTDTSYRWPGTLLFLHDADVE
ncbi:MAG: hypothetical protein CUN55_00465 [Phototrophicales bacterium]|nr:MAG: hypothetical protein CUN55_00465 [Phototrophicales bacterium]